jgi:6-phosphogluconolactonase
VSSFLSGSYTKRGSSGIMKIEFDPSNHSITSSPYVKLDNPTYLCVDQNVVFSVGSVLEQAGMVLINDGVIKDMLLLEEKVPCHISVNSHMKHVYTANYHQGQIMIASYSHDILNHIQTIKFPNGSKAHYVGYESSIDALIMCDLGLDCVRSFRFDGTQYQLLWESQFPQGCGPRHTVKHPTKPILYVLAELSGEVFTCDLSQEGLVIKHKTSSYPPQFKTPWAAAIRITQDGRHCYTSNRGHDSITHFLVDEKGHLHFESRVSTYGKQPRDFNLINQEQHLCVLNHDDDRCVIFKRLDNGSLEYLSETQVLEGVCVCLTSS